MIAALIQLRMISALAYDAVWICCRREPIPFVDIVRPTSQKKCYKLNKTNAPWKPPNLHSSSKADETDLLTSATHGSSVELWASFLVLRLGLVALRNASKMSNQTKSQSNRSILQSNLNETIRSHMANCAANPDESDNYNYNDEDMISIKATDVDVIQDSFSVVVEKTIQDTVKADEAGIADDSVVSSDEESSTSLHLNEGDRVIARMDKFVDDGVNKTEAYLANSLVMEHEGYSKSLITDDKVDHVESAIDDTTTSSTTFQPYQNEVTFTGKIEFPQNNATLNQKEMQAVALVQNFVPSVPDAISLGFGRALPIISSGIPPLKDN